MYKHYLCITNSAIKLQIQLFSFYLVASFGKPCEEDIQCSAEVSDSICINKNNSTEDSICGCPEGHHLKLNGCFKRKGKNRTCTLTVKLDSLWKMVVINSASEFACHLSFTRRLRAHAQVSLQLGTSRDFIVVCITRTKVFLAVMSFMHARVGF